MTAELRVKAVRRGCTYLLLTLLALLALHVAYTQVMRGCRWGVALVCLAGVAAAPETTQVYGDAGLLGTISYDLQEGYVTEVSNKPLYYDDVHRLTCPLTRARQQR
jgi:hypothetical protein